MILNISIFLFIVLMGYWWGRQGLFSAFLHLLATIAAGAIAFALWEPITIGWLIDRMPHAWGVGLVAPFVLALIAARVALDKLVPGNLYFSTLVNWIGGSVLGVFAGFLSAGILIIGLGYLKLPANLAGYQPYHVGAEGEIIDNPEGGGMLFPVDSMAGGFYSGLSNGAFHSGRPMSEYAPKPGYNAALYRMAYDPNSSVLATPAAVEVTNLFVANTPIRTADDSVVRELGDAVRTAGSRLVVVDTRWTQDALTFDEDALRIYPPQVRLISVSASGEGSPEMHAPLGVSRSDTGGGGGRQYVTLRNAENYATADQRGAMMGWVFVLPLDREPRFLMIRRLRLALPEPAANPALAPLALGRVVAPPATTGATATGTDGAPGDPSVGGQTGRNPGAGATDLTLSVNLPIPVSKNKASGFDIEGDKIRDGNGLIGKADGHISEGVRVTKLHVPPNQAGVRLELEQQRAQSLLGASTVAAASLGGVWLEDAGGSKYFPIAFVWHQNVSGALQVKVERTAYIRSAAELPTRQMLTGDKLYLYFMVPHGVTIKKVNIGTGSQTANLEVP